MKLKMILLLLVTIMYSCGSSKKVTSNKKVVNKRVSQQPKVATKDEVKVVAKPQPVVEEKHPEVVKPEPVKTVVKSKSYKNLTEEYILKFANKAVSEMHMHKIPASITLAQGVLESGSGNSELALKSNNHFGIKCHKGWKGSSVSHDDDAIGECFRKYTDPRVSYEDHSKFLTSRKRYASLFKLHPTDYTGWAHGLRKAGYATDPRYPQKLISIINRYDLHAYDLIENPNKEHKTYSNIHSSSSTYHTVQKGDTLYSISRRNNVTVEELKAKNNLYNNTLSIGQKLLIN